MAIKYLYLDDAEKSSLESLVDNVSQSRQEIEIDTKNPSDFNLSIDNLISSLGNYQGLILDWRLDNLPDQNGQHFNFRAGTVAQEIRIREAEGTVPSLPIVLWSTNTNLKVSYYSDTASHDLFDQRHYKELIPRNGNVVAQELISLSIAYERIKQAVDKERKISLETLGLEEKDKDILPSSFVGFLDQKTEMSSHEYARILLKEIVHIPGVLINEELLASKLGIDKRKSEDWRSLLEILSPFMYTGPFGDAWKRWWWQLLDKKWWRLFEPSLPVFQSMIASERVENISTVTGLKKLVAAEPIRPEYQTNYQTICEFYRRPLDTIDGLTIKEKEPYMWQEKRYLSIDAAIRRIGFEEGLRPHPVEIERLKLIKEVLQN